MSRSHDAPVIITAKKRVESNETKPKACSLKMIFRLLNPNYWKLFINELSFNHKDFALLDAFISFIKNEMPKKSIVQKNLASPLDRDIDQIAHKILKDQRLIQNLSTTFPDDLWINRGILPLIKWLRSGRRPTKFPMEVGVELDAVATTGRTIDVSSFGAKCDRAVRRLVPPRKDMCIIASARNEGIYLIDWVAHHRALGFRDIFLYTNNNTDDSDDLLRALSKAGFIKLIYNRVATDISPQIKAYGHAHQILPDTLDFEWTAAIDIDEYIMYNHKKFETFSDWLDFQRQQNLDSIGLFWGTPGGRGQASWVDKPVVERFPLIMDQEDRHFKSIFKMSKFFHNQIHHPVDDIKRQYGTASGDMIANMNDESKYDLSSAWVCHFYFKSAEEFLTRRVFNRGDSPVSSNINLDLISTRMIEKFLLSNVAPVYDFEPVDARLSERVSVEREQIRAAAGVSKAHAKCCDHFRHLSRLVLNDMRTSPRFQRPATPESEFLRNLSGH